MRNRTRLALLVGVALLWALPAVPQTQGRAPAGRQAGTAKQPGAQTGAPGLTAACQPLGRADFDTVMRRMELAKQSNDIDQMRRALDDSERLLSEVVDRMENCVGAPGTFNRQTTTGVGGFAPRSVTGGTPGEGAQGGMATRVPPPESVPGGEGNWPDSGTPRQGTRKP